jgi:hypothetical protein
MGQFDAVPQTQKNGAWGDDPCSFAGNTTHTTVISASQPEQCRQAWGFHPPGEG